MSVTRFTSLILSTVAGFALVVASQPATARQPGKDDLPKVPSGDISALRVPTGIPAAELKKAREVFAAYAKYYADYITNPRVYTTPQEFNPTTKGESVKTVDQLITDLNRHILAPLPNTAVVPENADYIREFGAALDDALKEVINTHPDQVVVQINAARLYAAACRSGASPHYPTVTALITNANTPPSVKYYIYQAAGNLLAAYDINNLQTRRFHSVADKPLCDLLNALRDAIELPNSILPAPVSPDQLQVLTFIRRQAIKALAMARFAEIQSTNPPASAYPALTLGRVATSDPILNPRPTTSEIAEAVIGICNMAPPRGAASAEPYAFAMCDALATGIVAFATPRAANPADKTLPWKGYAIRITEALKGWAPIFDPNFAPGVPPTGFPVPKPVTELAVEAERRILGPMDGVATRIDLAGLRGYRDSTLRSDKKWTDSPYRDKPNLKLILKGKE